MGMRMRMGTGDKQRMKDASSSSNSWWCKSPHKTLLFTCDWAQSRFSTNVSPARRSATRCRCNNALPPPPLMLLLLLLPASVVTSVVSAVAAPLRGSKGVAGGMCR